MACVNIEVIRNYLHNVLCRYIGGHSAQNDKSLCILCDPCGWKLDLLVGKGDRSRHKSASCSMPAGETGDLPRLRAAPQFKLSIDAKL